MVYRNLSKFRCCRSTTEHYQVIFQEDSAWALQSSFFCQSIQFKIYYTQSKLIDKKDLWTPFNNLNEGGIECIQSDEDDPEDGVAAIQMYGISIQPLIDEQSCKTDSHHTKQAWYADDASPAGAIEVVELDMCTRS